LLKQQHDGDEPNRTFANLPRVATTNKMGFS
jgi:hypothetical protein